MKESIKELLHRVDAGIPVLAEDMHRLAVEAATPDLVGLAGSRRDQTFGDRVTYSRKVFIPLTKLCRDVCHYCTFAHSPQCGKRAFLTPEEIFELAEAGRRAGCKEALFTLGDKPELRYRVAREELAALKFDTTLDYLGSVAQGVLEQTGLLPHLNPGVMGSQEIARLRRVSASQGLMLENVSSRLCERGGPHVGSPDKEPSKRLATITAAGELAVPFTTGILIGIGETVAERVDTLLAFRDLHARYGHIQEVIVQNFRAKPSTKMARAPEPSLDELVRTVALARLALPMTISLQAPPNLSPNGLQALLAAGIDDWGGVSPLTPDHVNPESPWPHLDQLAKETQQAGKTLSERLTVYPRYLHQADEWLDDKVRSAALTLASAEGLARCDDWVPGAASALPELWDKAPALRPAASLSPIIDRAMRGDEPSEEGIVTLFSAQGSALGDVCRAANELRRQVCGDEVTYVVTRNINYTNVCFFRCGFCAFSKGRTSENLRGRPYLLDLEEVARRVREARSRGATEVCMQGGIHPTFTGRTYIEICNAARAASPEIHLHAFSPLEISQGAATLGITVEDYLPQLVDAGLRSLPGTAAEILDDEVRAVLCPDKLDTQTWLNVMRAAHQLGLKSTSTMMFGHVDTPRHWARHLLHLRRLQAETGGFTEFVPLPFVPMETPIWLKGHSRKGPSFRETVLVHAVARLALHPLIPNIQVSWVKLGQEGAKACLMAGANDLGGTLMDESISRAAGSTHGQEMRPEDMDSMIYAIGRQPRQRNTFYGTPDPALVASSYGAEQLCNEFESPARDFSMSKLASGM